MFWPIDLRGVGAGTMFVPLAASTVAGLRGPDLAPGSAMFNLARQLGGSVGLAWLATRLTTATPVNRANLVTYVSADDPRTEQRLSMLTNAIRLRVWRRGPGVAAGVGVITFCCLPLIFLQNEPTGPAPADLHGERSCRTAPARRCSSPATSASARTTRSHRWSARCSSSARCSDGAISER